jgi:16S rRNA G527 N7-methylase RsmG
VEKRIPSIQEPAMAMSLLGGAGPVILDAGSGGGFPGLPFKILDREREVVLIEASGKKATFLREVVETLELEGVRIIEGRFEDELAGGALETPVNVLTARAWTGWAGLLGLGARSRTFDADVMRVASCTAAAPDGQ